MQLLLNKMSTISILSYLVTAAAFITLLARYKQIKETRTWAALLIAGLFLGAGPIIAIFFFAINRNIFTSNSITPVEASMSPNQVQDQPGYNQQTVAPAHVLEPVAAPNTTSKRVKTTGTIIGSIVGVVLMVCGLLVVGVLLLAAAAAASCANDPKCM